MTPINVAIAVWLIQVGLCSVLFLLSPSTTAAAPLAISLTLLMASFYAKKVSDAKKG